MLGKRTALERNDITEFAFLDDDEHGSAAQISKALRPACDGEIADHLFVPTEDLVVHCTQPHLPGASSEYEHATQILPDEDEERLMTQADSSQATFSQFCNNIYKEHGLNQAPAEVNNTGCKAVLSSCTMANQAISKGTINDDIAESIRAARDRAGLLHGASAQGTPPTNSVTPIVPVASMNAALLEEPVYTQTQDDITFSQFCHNAYESTERNETQEEKEAQTDRLPIQKSDTSINAGSHTSPGTTIRPLRVIPAPTVQLPSATTTLTLPATRPALSNPPPSASLPTATPVMSVPTTAPPLKAILYFDGGALGNPGVGGAGYVLYPDYLRPPHVFPAEPIAKAAVRMIGSNCTNNQAEYTGLIHGLQAALERGVRSLDVYGDSQLVIKQMTGEYKVKNPVLKGMNRMAQLLASGFTAVAYHWVDRNKNKPADALSSRAMHQPWTAEETADPII